MDLEETPWADSTAQPASQTSDIPASQESASTTKPKPSLTLSNSGSSTRAPRTTPRRVVAQPTRLEAVDDPLGPLGGSNTPSDSGNVAAAIIGEGTPPVPPLKEQQQQMRTTMQPQQIAVRSGPRDPHRIDDDDDEDELLGHRRGLGSRAPPPVQAASPTVASSNAPSVSVEQAAKPSFYITVGDPHKVGDLTSSHIVYSVRTKVCNNPPAPKILRS